MVKVYDIKALRAEYEKKKREEELTKFHLLIRWENKDGSEFSEITHYNEMDDLTDDIRKDKMSLFIEHYRNYPSPILLCVYCGQTPLYMSTVYGHMTMGAIIQQIMDTAKNILDYSRGL
jgi:hypothetical protein